MDVMCSGKRRGTTTVPSDHSESKILSLNSVFVLLCELTVVYRQSSFHSEDTERKQTFLEEALSQSFSQPLCL